MKFKAGDIVRLKSGGQDMTVASGGKRTVGVVWMHDGELDRAELPADVLELVHAPVSPSPDPTAATSEARD